MYLLPNFGVFILFIFCVNGYELPAYNNGGFGREQIEFVDLTIRTKRETVSKENLDDLASITSEKNAPIGKDGHDFFRSTVGNSDEYSTGEEYEDAYTVDPDRHMKSFNGTDIGITNPTEDSHMYYNSSFYPEVSGTWKEYWLDLKKDPESHTVLPGAHRKTATIYVTFDFPFYGHIVNNVTIATGGFLYMGDYLQDYLNALAAKQYAAPLLADFDTMSNPNSSIRYKDNGTALTVHWDQVVMHKRTDLGSFTFQLILKNTGEVLFVYKDVPVNITDISDDKHPVRVGLYDAYIIEKTLFFVSRKIIVWKHKVDFKDNYFIGNGTLLYFTPLPTCLSLKTCSECVQGKETIGFQCIWCPLANRCSDGIDRKRQDWLIKACDSNHLGTVEKCNEYEELMKNNSLTSKTTTTTSTTTRTTTTTPLPTTEELLIVSEALAPQNNDWDRFPEKNFIDDHEEKTIITDDELLTLSNILLYLDEKNPFATPLISLQGKTRSGSQEDLARQPLFGPQTASEAVVSGTSRLIKHLYDNYSPEVNNNEQVTQQHLNEEEAFFQAVLATEPMKRVVALLQSRGLLPTNNRNLESILRTLWFERFSRSRGSLGSSGFEHIFLGEVKNAEPSGFHSWLYFKHQEEAGSLDYLGFIRSAKLSGKASLLELPLKWKGMYKPVNSMFVGTSPELEMALYTLCFYARPEAKCPMNGNSVKFFIQTYPFKSRGKVYLGTAYPTFR